jgi:hypothetical protein
MLSILGHKGNANQYDFEIFQLTPVRVAIINYTTTNAGKDVWKK